MSDCFRKGFHGSSPPSCKKPEIGRGSDPGVPGVLLEPLIRPRPALRIRPSINPRCLLDRRGGAMTKDAKAATNGGFQSTGAAP
jgi:hypothetical protein